MAPRATSRLPGEITAALQPDPELPEPVLPKIGISTSPPDSPDTYGGSRGIRFFGVRFKSCTTVIVLRPASLGIPICYWG